MLNKAAFLLFFLFFCYSICQCQNIITSKNFIKIESSPFNVLSVADTVIIKMDSFVGDLRIVTHQPFLLSIDGITNNDTLIIPNSQSNTNIPIYISMLPMQADKMYRGEVFFQDINFTLSEKLYVFGSSILSTESISFCTWNVKWFGLPTQCGCDTAIARTNVTRAMQEINADIFALQEIVDIPSLQKVTADLGPHYDYAIADYGSQISNSTLSGYATVQKLAFIYNKNKITNLGTFGLLRSTYPAQQSTNSPYYYFASGRWPFVMKAAINNWADTVQFVNLHAKAFAGNDEHNRRAGGATKIADSLQALFPNKKNIVLGDYNDILEGAISTGFTVSPYDYLLNNNFVGITRPSLYPGEYTYVGNAGKIIDNVLLSSEAANQYISQSTIILRELEKATPNYQSETTDHLPILSFLKLNFSTAVKETIKKNKINLIQPNHNTLKLILPKEFRKHGSVCVITLEGNLLFEKNYINQNVIEENIPFLQQGVYLVVIKSIDNMESITWLVN